MLATLSTAQMAMARYQDRTFRMPSFRFSMPAKCMCMFAAASASIIIIRTDVIASVSLFVWLLLVLALLVTLVVLISLLLTGLTRLLRLECLVGLITERAAHKVQGV